MSEHLSPPDRSIRILPTEGYRQPGWPPDSPTGPGPLLQFVPWLIDRYASSRSVNVLIDDKGSFGPLYRATLDSKRLFLNETNRATMKRSRRRYLTELAAVGTAILAGCASGESTIANSTRSRNRTRPPSATSTGSPPGEMAANREETTLAGVPDGAETVSATVTRVVDGDTMEVTLEDGTEDTLRLLGVDTPETFSENEPDEYGLPTTIAAKDWLANWGDRATSFATDRLDGAEVTIAIDPESDRRGSYGRLLCYLIYTGSKSGSGGNGTNFNRQLLDQGARTRLRVDIRTPRGVRNRRTAGTTERCRSVGIRRERGNDCL